MTVKDLVAKLKSVGKFGVLTHRRAISQIWLGQLILAAILTLGFLFADFLIYRNFVIRRVDFLGDEGFPKTVFLKKKGLENAVKKTIEHKNFLENPKFP